MAVTSEASDPNASAPKTPSDRSQTPHDRFTNASKFLSEALTAATRAYEYVQLAGDCLRDPSISEQLANMNGISESWKTYLQFRLLFGRAESLRPALQGIDSSLDDFLINYGMVHQAFQSEAEFRKKEDSIESQMIDQVIKTDAENVMVMMKGMLTKKLGDETLPMKLRLKLEQVAEEENDASS